MLKSSRGVTLTILVFTIIILLILSSVTVMSIRSQPNVKQYNSMISDIEMLRDKVLVYYNKYGSLPVGNVVDSSKLTNLNVNTEDIYYEIDITKLDNLTLNYGKGQEQEDTDVYIINNTTLEVYYLKGIELNGTIYYKLNDFNN